jgi:hypothetical protein
MSRPATTGRTAVSDAEQTPEETETGRMGREIIHALHAHPLVRPIMEELERRREGKILLGCHANAVWAEALRTGGAQYEVSARIEHPEWWVPKMDAREDHVRKLVAWLARRLSEQWDARQSVPIRQP